MFQPQTLPRIPLFFAILLLACCEWLTLTNAEPYGFSASKNEVPVGNNFPGNFVSTSSSSSFGTGSVSATAQVASISFAGLSQDQIDSQLAVLRTGDMININNVRYMALRTEEDPGRRDTIILVQVAGQSDESLSVQSDSYSAAISHLKDVPVFDESTGGKSQSYIAPSSMSSNREKIISDVGAPSSSYSAPYSSAAIRRQEESAVVASVNGGAGVNDPSSLSSYSSQELMASSNRQSSAGRDHSSSYSYPPSATSAGRIRPNQNNGYEDYSNSIPGVAGQDYPILARVVDTSFTCKERKEGGYYADVESSCQVYHICALKKKFSFLCPNGTVFDQRVFVCNWWYNVDCASSANYYNLNDLIGISPPPTQQNQAVQNSIHFPSSPSSYGAGPTKLVVQQQSFVSQKPLKPIYGPPPSPLGAVPLQPLLIEEAIKRPSNGLKAPLIQAVASSAY